MAQPPSAVRATLQVLFAVMLVAVGQLCMRRGMVEIDPIVSAAGLVTAVKLLLTQPEIFLWACAGIAAYVLATLAWLQVLAQHELSFVFPLTSISYVLVYIGAVNWPILGEQALPSRTLGIVLIVVGVALIARSGRKKA